MAFPSGVDALVVSTYFYFEKSDASGFTVLPNEYKTKFANEMKIPLLSLGLGYTWIPDLKNIESLLIDQKYVIKKPNNDFALSVFSDYD